MENSAPVGNGCGTWVRGGGEGGRGEGGGGFTSLFRSCSVVLIRLQSTELRALAAGRLIVMRAARMARL